MGERARATRRRPGGLQPQPAGVGLPYRFTLPRRSSYFPKGYGLRCLRSLARRVGRPFTFPVSRLSVLRMSCGAHVGESAWNPGLSRQQRVRLVVPRGEARSMLRPRVGHFPGVRRVSPPVPAPMGISRSTCAASAPEGSTPKKEGDHERACHPLPRCVLPLGAVLRRLAVQLPEMIRVE